MWRKNGRIARRISFLCCSSKRRMHTHTHRRTARPEGLLIAHLLKTAFPVRSRARTSSIFPCLLVSMHTPMFSLIFFCCFVHTFRVHEFHIVFERAVRLCACLELVILFYSILFIHLVFVRCLFVCTQIQRYFLSCSLVRPRIYISSLFLLKIHKLMLNMNLLLLLLLLRALLYPTTQTGYIISFLSIYRSHDFFVWFVRCCTHVTVVVAATFHRFN